MIDRQGESGLSKPGTEEQVRWFRPGDWPIKVKGFAEPVRCYKVLGLYDDLAEEGAVIRVDSDGFKVLLDLNKRERAEAIAALEAIVDG